MQTLNMQEDEIIKHLRLELGIVKPQIMDTIKDADNFRDDWNLDSLELVEFVARIEQTFKILIPDKDLQQFYSLSATAAYLRSKMIAA
ncbi:MAG: acyl carrier protein [Agriterribacter sp.]